MKVVIRKGKILKGDIVEMDYTQQSSSEQKPAELSLHQEDPPHPDLVKAMKALTPHAILICEFLPVSSITDIKNFPAETLKQFNCSGFSSIGSGDNEGVVLTCQRTLSTGKVFGFNTQTVRFGDVSENAYTFMEELVKAVKKAQDEFAKYLNGKFGKPLQSALDLKD